MIEKIILILSFIVMSSFVLSGQSVFSASVEIQNLSSINNTFISGKVFNSEQQEIYFKYHRNNISFDEESIEVPLLEDNDFQFSFTLEAANPIYLMLDDGREIELYLEPEDSLAINFDIQSVDTSLVFEGKGNDKNSFLFDFNKKFDTQKKELLKESISNDRDFVSKMDSLYVRMKGYYQSADKENWSKGFQHYMMANIDYWWASNLLKFKKHHRLSSTKEFSDFEHFDYYSFLSNVNVNNEFALNNSYYLEFLEQFVKFCSEYPNPVKYIPIHKKRIENKQSETTIQRFVKVHMHGIDVYDSPYSEEPKVIAKLDYGTELQYLRNKTTDNLKYRKGSHIYNAYYFQIETSNGETGWISGAGISFVDKRVMNKKVEEKYAPLIGTKSIEQFLQGKVYYFVKAKSLYWKTFLNDLDEDFAMELADFRNESPYPEYTKILSKAYEVAQLRGKGDMNLVNTYAFSNLRTIIVEGVDIQLPFERTSKVSRSKSLSKARKEQFFEDIEIFDSQRCGQRTTIQVNMKCELVLYTNDLLFSEKRYPIKRKKNIQLDLYQPILGEIIIGKAHFPIKISPGDDLVVLKSNIANVSIPKYEQKGSGVNSYLRDLKLKFDSDLFYLEDHKKKDTPSKFKKYILDLEEDKMNFIDGYPSLTAFEKQYWKEDAKYWTAVKLLEYAHQYTEKGKLADSYFTFIENVDISKDWMLPNLNYSYFLDSYLEYFEMAFDEVLEGEAKNYQKAKSLAYQCMGDETAEAGLDILKFVKDCENPSYCETVTSLYNEKKGLLEGAKAIDFTLEDIAGNQVALSDFEGKVIFVDFWASWCVPCIRSMYKSQQLISDRKDVVFINVSLDDDIDQWRSFVKSRNFKGVHLFLDRDKFSITDIQKIYQAYQLPKYILIDKNFNIAFPQAGKPSTSLWNNQVHSLQKESMK